MLGPSAKSPDQHPLGRGPDLHMATSSRLHNGGRPSLSPSAFSNKSSETERAAPVAASPGRGKRNRKGGGGSSGARCPCSSLPVVHSCSTWAPRALSFSLTSHLSSAKTRIASFGSLRQAPHVSCLRGGSHIQGRIGQTENRPSRRSVRTSARRIGILPRSSISFESSLTS